MIDKPGCMEALKEVERLLDGELEGELRINVEKHLSGCSPCMDRAEFRRHLKVMIAAKCTGRCAVPRAVHPGPHDHRGTRHRFPLMSSACRHRRAMPYHSVPSDRWKG